MDRASLIELNAEQMSHALERSDHCDRWNSLVEIAGERAPYVLGLVCRMVPERITDLRSLEVEQAEHGAGFLGMLPDQIPDDLPLPSDLATSLDVALRFSGIRAKNLEALAETMPEYPLTFAGKTFDPGPLGDMPEGWRLAIDIAGIQAILDLFDAPEPNIEDATTIACMPPFVEMMRHRRELGYVPEPLIDADGFAWCLVHAASCDPVDELWKWLHPHNFFDLSDLHANRAEYRRLIDQLVEGDVLATYILGRIAPYASQGIVFEDCLSFAVGWAIRGWATQTTGGMNIEHAKDNFAQMLPTLIHETFHRFQAQIALGNPQIEELGFDRITSYPFEAPSDCRIYQALSYIMLEGSATYAASSSPSPAWTEDAKAGLQLLEQVREIDDPSGKDDRFGELTSEGLRSNGPFYGLGALLSHKIVEHNGASNLGDALSRGAPSFIESGLTLLSEDSVVPSELLAAQIARLRKELGTHA
jgi:hypothetical protein